LSVESGNGAFGDIDFVTDNSQGGGDALSITSMYYQFPLGGFEVAVGPILDNDDLMRTTVTKYSDKFFMAGNPLTGSDFYAAPGITGSGVAIARNFDNGFNTSLSVIGLTADTTDGFLTDEGSDAFTLSAGYDGDNYGLGIIFTDNDNLCGAVAGFQTCDELGVPELDANTTTIGGYFTPNDGKTTLSATYGIASASVGEETIDDINDLHFGLDHELGNGVLSAAMKSSEFWLDNGKADYLGEYYEIYYTYDLNDSTEIIGGVAFAMPDETAPTAVLSNQVTPFTVAVSSGIAKATPPMISVESFRSYV
jgi:hypothetical protein